ncbi:MAG: hypothetical protein EA374_04490 [Acholeplasmatales bacterium]|nr:MAG: hypothetical protein EA374_04490 [Acholeplasmatales bacterium]
MYQIDVIKTTALAKKLGGLPIFHGGYLHALTVTADTLTLHLQLLSHNNPLLANDTRVLLKLKGLRRFSFASEPTREALMMIHDLDIRKEEDVLHLRLECTQGNLHEAVFASIELTDETND